MQVDRKNLILRTSVLSSIITIKSLSEEEERLNIMEI